MVAGGCDKVAAALGARVPQVRGRAGGRRGEVERLSAGCWSEASQPVAQGACVGGEVQQAPAGRVCIHAVISRASITMAVQILFWPKPCRGRLARPVSLAMRMRSSHRLVCGGAARGRAVGSCPAGTGVGRERGDPVAVDVLEPQLRARVRTFLAHDDAHPVGPRAQIEQPGELGDPRPVADLVVRVVGGSPRTGVVEDFEQVRVPAGSTNPTE